MTPTTLGDEFTALAYARSVLTARTAGLLTAAGLVLLAGAAWLPWAEAPEVALNVLPTGVLVIWTVDILSIFVFPPLAMPLTWRPSTKRLLAEQPWRETAVRVLNVSGTKLWAGGDRYLRVAAMSRAVRELVVRAGKVWVAGPDDDGRLVVRVDGVLTLWPARLIPPVRGTAALPTSEPIARIWLGADTWRRQRAVVNLLASTGVAEIALAMFPEPTWGMIMVGVNFLGMAAVREIQMRQSRRLLPTGPWVRAEATSQSWRPRWNGTVEGTVLLDLPDGRALTAHFTRAPLEIVANTRRENALWLAGGDVVGFPHYPVLAKARLSLRT